MRKLGLGVALCALMAGQALAGTGTITVKDASGVTQTFDVVTDGGGAFIGKQTLCDSTAGANCITVTATGALKVDNSGVTQPVNGTVTANAGTGTFGVAGTVTANAGSNLNTSLLALDTSINGLLLSQGAATSGQKAVLMEGAVTTNPPAYTTANSNPLSLDISGLLRMSLKDTPSNTNNFNVNIAASAITQAVSGNVTAAQGGAPWSVTGSGSAGTPAPGVLSVQGIGSMTPIKVDGSGVTQPVSGVGTFTTSDTHFPASGALSDALTNPTTIQLGANLLAWDATNTVWRRVQVDAGTGTLKVDTGTVTVTGTVTTTPPSNATANITQFGGVNLSTGTGTGGTGIPRVTVSSDSFPASQVVTGTLTGNQGTPAAAANRWPVQLTDGTNLQGMTLGGAAFTNQRDSAGRELGVAIQGQPVVPILVATLPGWPITPSYKQVLSSSLPPSGLPMTGASGSPGSAQQAQVVNLSPNPSLQCPFALGISQTTSTKLVAGQTGRKMHICGVSLVSASAQNVSLVEGTGTVCATGTLGLYGGSTASAAFAANGGIHSLLDRIQIPMQQGGDDICLLQSGAGNVSGTLTYGNFLP